MRWQPHNSACCPATWVLYTWGPIWSYRWLFSSSDVRAGLHSFLKNRIKHTKKRRRSSRKKMWSVEEKLKNMASTAKKQVKVFKAKFDEKVRAVLLNFWWSTHVLKSLLLRPLIYQLLRLRKCLFNEFYMDGWMDGLVLPLELIT